MRPISVRVVPLPASHSVLDRLEVRFATFRDAPAEERAQAAEQMRTSQAAEAVLFETCHRVELITVDADRSATSAQQRGADAVQRVFEVVAGFDSAVVAEEQLLGQVRSGYEKALVAGQSGPILNELMRRALRFGRLVRSHARPGTDRSLADPATAWLQERVPRGGRVVVAGAGQMGCLLARGLATVGFPVTIATASEERGRGLLESLPGQGHALAVGPLGRHLVSTASGLALAVRGARPALTSDMVALEATPWVVDLSTPSAVESALAERLGQRLLSLDELGQCHGSSPVLEPGVEVRLRRRLGAEVRAFVEWLEGRQGADAASVLHRSAEDVRLRHLDRLRRKGSLDDTQFAAVEAASAAMFGEFLHQPTLELRHGGADADTVRRLFGTDL